MPLPSAIVRRLSVFLLLLGAPVWLPWVFPAAVGEAPGLIVTAPLTARTAAVADPQPITAGVQTPTLVAPPVHRTHPPATPPATRSAASVVAHGTTRTNVSAPRLRPRPQRAALAADFPDPDLIRVGPTWWAYATGTRFGDLQARFSPDLATWSAAVDPLPRLPAWAIPGFSWAPAVMASGTGFLMYYSARDAAYGSQCLSVASSPVPAGPFVDSSVGPLTCQTGVGGSIDPAPFTASDGSRYLLWKSENNALGAASRIGAQRLTADGLSLAGDRPRLLTATAPWQAGVVEGPSMIVSDGHYYLFYGANRWDTASAGIGYAVCRSPMGPCTDESRAHPWLRSAPGALGPSGPDPFIGPDGEAWVAYHAWSTNAPSRARQLWIMPLTFVDGVPVIG